MTVYRQEFGEK